jgi:hypothetical protein
VFRGNNTPSGMARMAGEEQILRINGIDLNGMGGDAVSMAGDVRFHQAAMIAHEGLNPFPGPG